MQSIDMDSQHRLRYRYPDWDARAFEMITCEITEIQYQDPSVLVEMLQRHVQLAAANNVAFSCTRIDCNDKELIQSLQVAGFYHAETSLCLSKNLNHWETPNDPRVRPLQLQKAEEVDFDAIKTIAYNGFEFGRFFEDPHIDKEKARVRNRNWIDDMRAQNKEILVAKQGNDVYAFHAQSMDGRCVDMILTGLQKEKSMLAYSLWAAILDDLKKRDMKTAITVISEANKKIVRLYEFLGFQMDKRTFGFHKWHGSNVHGNA